MYIPKHVIMAQGIEKKTQKIVAWPQWIAGVGVTLLLLQLGMMASWSSPYVAQLTSPGSPIPMTMTEASWVVSLLNFGRIFSPIIGSMCVNYFGSKTTILITTIPMTISWVLYILADNVVWLYGGRFFGGISLGMSYSCFSLYIGEIADPSIRGALVTIGMTGLPIGNLMMCVMGAYLSLKISSAISFGLVMIVMILFLWLPESPHHLVKNKMDDKAKASIGWYHRDLDVDAELTSLRKFVENVNGQSFINNLKEFAKPQIRTALMLNIMLFMYSQMCGLNNILFYMETILKSAQVTVLDPAVIVIIVMAFGVGGSCLSVFLIDRCGRKILMSMSCFGVSVSLLCLGAEFQLLGFGYDPEKVQGLSIFAVIFLYLTVFIGVLAVPSAVLSEIFPPHVKCIAACFGSISAGLFSFISSATYQPLIDLMGEQYVFFLYALLLMSAVPFTMIFLPETKGKSLQEIQDKLMRKS